MPACQPWQLCVGTRCETGVLTLRRPVVGATFGAGDADVSAVRFQGSVNAAVWTADFFTLPPDAVGQPALDVVRDGAGTQQCSRGLGVLYVPTVTSGVARVMAVLVDSPGLDPLAAWPKYQRDNRNSGFADSSLAAACP